MPDSYINPPYSPPQAGKTWFPTTFAKGDDIGTGYSIARCVRGQFYNVQATKSILETNKIRITTEGTILTDQDSEVWPFYNTYRPLPDPNSYIGLPPMKSMVLSHEYDETGLLINKLQYSMKLPNITFKLGSFSIEYSLSFDPYDDSIFDFVKDETDIKAILEYRAGNQEALGNFQFQNYPVISLYLENKKFYPDNGTTPLTLSLTGIHKDVIKNGIISTVYPETTKLDLITGSSLTGLQRPSADNLKLALSNEDLYCASLRLRIRKIWLFRAFDETNLNPRNLPCNILGYAVTLRKVIDPEKNTYFVTFPKGDNYRPTVNLKLFDPEARTNSAGFAHGVNLRFYFASVPISGIFDAFGGLGFDSPIQAYQFTLLGIQAGKRQARYCFFEDEDLKKKNPNAQYLKLNKIATLTKNKSFSLQQEIKQEPGLINADTEIGIFVALDETTPVSLKSGVNFSKGLFRASFKCSTINNFNNNNYHIYFRMWFAPKDAVQKNSALAYRSNTEVCFESTATTTKIVRRSPTKYDEVLISPPATSNSTQFEIGRYISDRQLISFPDIQDIDQAVLVVGVYAKASGVNVSGTVVNFTFDTDEHGFDTPIYQVISKELHPIRNPSETSFTSNSYLKVANTLKVSSSMTGRRPIPIVYQKPADADKNYTYRPYKNKFLSYNGSSDSYAFEDVALLKKPDDFEIYDTGKLNITITEELFRSLSKVTSPSKTIIADFVTDIVSLQNGRINTGPWAIKVVRNKINDVSIDFNLIIEGLLVDTQGKVISRLFKSKELKDSGGFTQTFAYNTNFTFPFLIDGSETQFVLRLNFLPFCDLQYTYSELLEYYETKLKIDFGFRIDSIEITQNTIEQERIIYNAPSSPSAIGSPAYYEDLPLTPTKILGADVNADSQFYFIASPESLGTKTVTPQDPYTLSGTLYSPTWFVDLPSNMEVRLNHSFGSAEPKFRTATSKVLKEDSIGVVNSGHSDTFIVAYSTNRTNANDAGEIDVLKVNSYGSSYDQYTVSSYDNSGNPVAKFLGTHPKLINFSQANNLQGSANQIYLMTEAISPEGNIISAAFSENDGQRKGWGMPAEQAYDTVTGFGNEVKKIFTGFNLFTPAIDKLNQTFYGAGYVEPGALIFKVNRSVNVSADNKNEYKNYLLAGVEPENKDLFSGLVDLRNDDEKKTEDPLLATHVDLIKVFDSNFLLHYVKNNAKYEIKSKTFNLNTTSPEFTLFTFKNIIPAIYSSLQIYGLSFYYDQVARILHSIFWCDSKLFYFHTSYCAYSPGANINPRLQLIAGNFTVDEKKNKLLYALVQEKYIVINNNDRLEELDVPLQRAGISLEKKGTSASLSVWYKDKNNDLVSRNIIPYGYVTEKKYYKGLSS